MTGKQLTQQIKIKNIPGKTPDWNWLPP